MFLGNIMKPHDRLSGIGIVRILYKLRQCDRFARNQPLTQFK